MSPSNLRRRNIKGGRRRKHELLRQRQDFYRTIWSLASSMLGSRVLGIIYPLLALSIDASPMQVGWVSFALTVPGLFLFIPAGVLADRADPRSVLLLTEICRGFTVLSIFSATLVNNVTILHIIVAAFLEGSLYVVYSLAETALISRCVSPELTRKRLVTVETGAHLAVLAGRPLGGMLFSCGAQSAFLVNVLLFVFSGMYLSAVTQGKNVRRSRTSVMGQLRHGVRDLRRRSLTEEISSGFREVRRHHFLRHAIVATTATNLSVNMLIIIFLAGSAERSPVLVGLVLAAGGIGGALGSMLVRLDSVRRYFRPSTRAVVTQMWIWVFALLIATLTEPIYYGLATFVTGCIGSMMNIALKTYEFNRVERSKLGRVTSVHRLAANAAICVAAPLGGWLAAESSHYATGIVFLFTVIMAVYVSVKMPNWRGRLAAAQ
ncbi:hypothetical protein HerbRD11066_09540 [Herbidospora sp. RD11066]